MDYYASNNSFNLANIPINKDSQDLSKGYDEIKTMINVSIVIFIPK